MNEIYGMCVVCGLLVAIVFSGEHDGNVNPSTKVRTSRGECNGCKLTSFAGINNGKNP